MIDSDVSGPSLGSFVEGTLIRTARGDRAIESLRVGDLVTTTSGSQQAIRRLVRYIVDCSTDPDPAILPIRVAAGAFGNGRPYRDLIVSPAHAVAVTCVTDVLIPTRLLVNGRTITPTGADSFTFWHVELDSHDIIFANGLAVESSLGSRHRDALEGCENLVLHPAAPKTNASCRARVVSGAVLSAVRTRLYALAGGTLVPPVIHAFHLVVDGLPVAPAVKGSVAAFVVPAGARRLRLVSKTWSPRDADPTSGDDRTLGILLEALSIQELLGAPEDIPLDAAGLTAGFLPIEQNATGRWRWTNGDAQLDASLWATCSGPFVLRLTGQFSFGGAAAVAAPDGAASTADRDAPTRLSPAQADVPASSRRASAANHAASDRGERPSRPTLVVR